MFALSYDGQPRSKERNRVKYIRYSRYTGEPAGDVDLQELLKRLGDFLLQSGFESQSYGVSEMDPRKQWKPCGRRSCARCRRAT